MWMILEVGQDKITKQEKLLRENNGKSCPSCIMSQRTQNTYDALLSLFQLTFPNRVYYSSSNNHPGYFFFFNIQLGVNIVFRHFLMQFQENHQQMSVWNQQRQQTSRSHGYVQTVTNTTQPLDSLFLTNSTAATKQKLLQWTGRQDTSSLVDLKSSQTTRYTCPVSPWEESVWQLNKCLYEHWRTVSGRNVVIYVCSIYFFVSGTEIF